MTKMAPTTILDGNHAQNGETPNHQLLDKTFVQDGDTNGLKPTPLQWVHNQFGSAGDDKPKPANWIPVHEEPLYTPRKIRIIIIGAGFSGLMAVHKVIHSTVELVIAWH